MVFYTEEISTEAEIAPVFKLAQLSKKYTTRLQQLGIQIPVKVNNTRLKNRILAQFPDVSDHREGRDVLLAFNKDLGPALKSACERNYDEEALILAKAA